MVNLPLRKLGDAGIVTDRNPYDLPLNAFSDGLNVIFDEGKAVRAPAFKSLYDQIQTPANWLWSDGSLGSWDNFGFGWNCVTPNTNDDNARLMSSYNHPANGSTLVVANVDKSAFDYVGGTFANVTPTVVSTGGTDTTPWTHTELAGFSVLCRSGLTPYVRDIQGDALYELMTSATGWASTTYAKAIRSYKDFFIALNVTKAGTTYDTMVKWCDPVQYRTAKSNIDWDETSTTNSAGENIIGNARTAIEDGLAMGNVFIIYTQTESIVMEFTGSSLIFSFRDLFHDDGVIAKNCVAAIGNTHYVFGYNDIYTHNGVQKQSLADDRVRRKIYSEMDRSKADKFFVTYDSMLDLVYFCYVSTDSSLGFTNTNYCNKAAVFNVRNSTWGFMDLPNIAGAAMTYSSAATKDVLAMVGLRNVSNGINGSRVYAVDLLRSGSVVTTPHPETIKTSYIERLGVDLDETQAPLRSMKQLNSAVPQIGVTNNAHTVNIKLGFTDLPTASTATYTSSTFTPGSEYKVDARANGRLVAYKIEETSGNYYNLSGIDFDITMLSSR